MRTLLSFAALALALGFTSPASAQMCSAGGMCGSAAQAQAQSSTPTPGATPGQSTPQQAGGCACCKNMAMMQQKGGQGMPGMEMPKQ